MKKIELLNKVPKDKDKFFFIGVSGSRSWNNFKEFDSILSAVYLAVREAFMLDKENIAIVSGGAKGVDSMAERWASEIKLPMYVINADWKNIGRAAGPIRNTKIVDTSDVIVAFPKSSSSGTWDTIKKAEKKNIPIMGAIINNDSENLDKEKVFNNWKKFVDSISPS